MNILSHSISLELGDFHIKSSTVQGDQLYLGGSNGFIRVYDITVPTHETQDDYKLLTLRQELKLLEGAIDQLGVLPDMRYLVLLSGGIIHVYNISNFQLEEKLSNFKNSNLFKLFSNINENSVLDETNIADESYLEKNSLLEYSDSMSLLTLNSVSHLITDKADVVQDYRSYIAICCKRKIIIYTFIKDEFNSKLEYNLSDKVKNLEFFSSEKLFIGLNNNDFLLVDLYNSDPQSSMTKIMAMPYLSSSVVNSSSTFSYFRNSVSKLSILRTLPNLNLISKESILLKVDDNGEFFNYKSRSKKNPLRWKKNPDLITYWFPYLILVYDNHTLEICRIRTGQCQQSLTFDHAIKLIEHLGEFLFVITDHSIELWNRVSFIEQLNQAKRLSRFEDAVSLIEKLQPLVFQDTDDSEISSQDKKFLMLREFQIKLAEELFDDGKIDKAVDLFISFMAPPDKVIELFPKLVVGDDLIDLSAFEDADSSDEMSITSPKKNSRRLMMSPKNRQRNHLNSMVRSLIPYLTDTRRKLNKLLNPESPKFEWKGVLIDKHLYLRSSNHDESLTEMISLVDTTLFKSYLLSAPRLVGPLLRVNNFCDIEVVERNLKLNAMYKELIDFYYAKDLHDKALNLLLELGSQNDIFHGPLPTIQYLQKLGDDNIELIFKYLKWPVSVNAELCTEIFLNDSIESESLNRFKVMQFLESTVQNESLTEKYLEHLIYELNDRTTKFHNKLIEIYISNGKVPELETLIQKSNDYDFRKNLELIEKQDKRFLPLQTIILSKLNEHRKVLKIFVNELQNYELALSYCLKLYKEDSLVGQELLTDLLMKYFNSPDTLNEALNLLATQGLKLDFHNVLDTLPPDISILELNKFIITNLKKFQINLNKSIMEKNLLSLRQVKLREQDLKLESNHIIIDENTMCSVCNKKLGYSILSWLPNDTVVHYGCNQKI